MTNNLFCVWLWLYSPLTDGSFVQIQENMVIDFIGYDSGPFSCTEQIARLGSPKFKERNEAYDFFFYNRRYVPYLFHGLYSKDAEIVYKSEVLIRFFYRCPDCNGSKVCAYCDGERYKTTKYGNYWGPCPDCNGYGICLSCEEHPGLESEIIFPK